MKRTAPILIVLLFLISSCSEDSPVGVPTYTPQVEAQWTDEKDNNHTFSFSTNDDSLSRGLFTGFEEYPDSNIFNSEIIGFFSNREIEFNVQYPTGEVKYKGSFIEDEKIELTSVKGKLVLVR